MSIYQFGDPTVSSVDVDVAIVGGGIGGLAAAVALQRVGITADVYERAPELGEVGGGVVIDAVTCLALRQWKLFDEFAETAVLGDGMEVRSINGELLGHFQHPDISVLGVRMPAEAAGQKPYSTYRADLHNLLLRQLPSARIHLGKRLLSAADRGTHAEAVFEDGTTVRARVLIGADGIHSVVRKLFDINETVYSGFVICRSLVRADRMPADLPNDRFRLWSSAEARINALTLPLRSGTLVAIDSGVFSSDPLTEEWDSVVPLDQLLRRYPPDFDPIIVNALHAGLVPTRAYPVYDRDPISVWSTDRITLLGDAAHPMLPNLGQGANQAIQDAAELARCLSTDSDIPAALKSYERVRAPHTATIQLASRSPINNPLTEIGPQ